VKLTIKLSEVQAHALRRLDGEPGSVGIHPQTWRVLERLLLVRRHEDADGVRWYLTDDGRDIARRLRAGGGR
jgi:hypothetical protein